MSVTLKYRGQLADEIHVGEETIEAAKVKDTLIHIKQAHGSAAAKTAKTMLIAVNGESILQRKMFKTPLNNGDVVSFFPICAGG